MCLNPTKSNESLKNRNKIMQKLVLGSTRFFPTRRESGPEVKGTAGTAHPDPRHGAPPIRKPKIKSKDSALNAGEGSRVIESQMKRHTLTLSGTFINAHTQIYPHARVHSLQYHTHLLA